MVVGPGAGSGHDDKAQSGGDAPAGSGKAVSGPASGSVIGDGKGQAGAGNL